MGRPKALAVLGLAVLLAVARAAIPECPESEPYGECADGNPCQREDACGAGEWCLRGCGCAHKCMGPDVVAIATMAPGSEAWADAAGGALEGAVEQKRTVAQQLASLAEMAKGLVHGPVALPPQPQLPDLAAMANTAHDVLRAAVRDALVAKARAGGRCPGGKAAAKCAADGCAARPCGPTEICVPECGSCEAFKCVNVSLPSLPRIPKLPTISLPRLPRVSWPKPPCANNEAMNLTATLKTIPATMLMSESKQISIQCSPCPNGTVSRQPALACTLCLPGTYAEREMSLCRRCAKGYYSPLPGAAKCLPCPANTFAPMQGSFGCIPCPLGFTTNARKAQSACAFDASYAKFLKG